MTDKKRIGVLTSGGDCAGLNAAIRAVVYAANQRGWEVLGIEDSTSGLLATPPRVKILGLDIFDGSVIRKGGTILGAVTRKHEHPFAFHMPDGSKKDRSEEVVETLKSLNLSALVCIGGDGSFSILRKIFAGSDINIIGIPKTIDNDLSNTDTTIGFDTAVQVATEALDRLQPTAFSHDRVMILEVMGRDAGYIALYTGIAGGADVILIPEIPYKLDAIKAKIDSLQREEGRNYALVVVSEAVRSAEGQTVQIEYADGQKRYGGVGHVLADEIAKATGAETRVTVLGHVQRGSQPTANDRLLASAMGAYAVELIEQKKFNRMVAWQNRSVTDISIDEAIDKYHTVDPDSQLVRTARSLGICMGDEA